MTPKQQFEEFVAGVRDVVEAAAADYLHDNGFSDYMEVGGGKNDLRILEALKVLEELLDLDFWDTADALGVWNET